MFNEDWYSDDQIANLVKLYEAVRGIHGRVVEIGCWEGKSTINLANACHPEVLVAVDSWEGNTAEDENHMTVQILKERDVFGVFQHNVQTLTKGNVEVRRSDCFDFLNTFREPIKFCHIDAAHDYESVKRTLELVKPLLVPGAILCGDDYCSAHAGRSELNGGVERACREVLPGHANIVNFWVWQHQ